MDVQFEDLTYTVSSGWINRTQKEVLKGVSGAFRAGQLSVIMGPSGAGKSSLLNAVSSFRRRGVTGTLSVNGQKRDETKFRKLSCYITQDDLLQPFVTVGELMELAARLKLPTYTTTKERHNIVSEVLDTLGLSETRNTMTEKLSGGQKRRLSIALELINNPPILFLDEPTSGLDVVSGSIVIRLLRKLSQQGRTVVATVHQPTASLFSLFHSVYVLSKGKCVYQGSADQLVPFLSKHGFKCPKTYNPADYVIEITDRDHEQNISILSAATCNGKTSLTNGSDDMSHFIDNNNVTDTFSLISNNQKYDIDSKLMKYTSSKAARACDANMSSFNQFLVLLLRMWTQILRNKIGLHIQFWHHIGCSLAVGVMFWGINKQGDQFFNHMKFCVGTVLFHAYTQCMIPILQFPTEVKLLKKEYFNGWYGLKPYFIALTLSKIPVIGLFSLMYLSTIYFMTGLPLEASRFILFSIIGLLVAFISEGMGLAIGSIFNVTNGSAVGPLAIAPILGLSVYGFDFIRQIPWFTWPLLKMSYLRSGVEALVICIFGMNRDLLDCTDMYCYFQDPKVTLHYLDIDVGASPYTEIATLCVSLVFFRALSYIGLSIRLKN